MHYIKPLHFYVFRLLKPKHGQRKMSSINIGFEADRIYNIYPILDGSFTTAL